MEVKEDFLNTLPICHEITQEELRSNVLVRMAQDVLRLFAPLMQKGRTMFLDDPIIRKTLTK